MNRMVSLPITIQFEDSTDYIKSSLFRIFSEILICYRIHFIPKKKILYMNETIKEEIAAPYAAGLERSLFELIKQIGEQLKEIESRLDKLENNQIQRKDK